MGAFAAYTFQSAVILLAGYLSYRWLLAKENQPVFNRWALLAIYLLSLALPLCHISLNLTGTPDNMGLAAISGIQVAAIGQEGPGNSIVAVLLWIYIAGVAAVACTTVFTLTRLGRLIAGGERTKMAGFTMVRISRGDIAPFSWGRYIVVSSAETPDNLELIIRHESAHIRLGHFYDLIVAQLVCIIQWYNPAAWLMLTELKAVHEYQADRAVVNAGVSSYQYQTLLIEKAVGVKVRTLANSLNNSNLKKRITMMNGTKSSPGRRLRALAAVPAMALALLLLNVPTVSDAMTAMSSAGLTASADTKAPETKADDVVEENPDVIAEYPGGLTALMTALCENIRYPEETYKAQIQGKVVVGFVVRTDGSMTDFEIIKGVDPLLDAEAIRAVRAIKGTWRPAQKDGRPVSCSFALPVQFKLQ